MPYAAYYLDSADQLNVGLDQARISSAIESNTGLVWVDVEEPGSEDRDLLLHRFGFHPLAVDTCLETGTHTARVEDYGSYLFVNARGIDYTLDKAVLQTADLSMFIGPNYVVTVHNIHMPNVEAIRNLVELDGRPLLKGPAFLAHAHLDALIQVIMPTLERMADHAEEIEEQILNSPDESALAALMTLKRSSLGLNRALAPQREVVSRLGRREFDLISGGADLYFRDLYEDLVRLQATNDVIRERADTSLATYLSAIANRQNEIMKVLSIVATIFMPLGLVAGIFGMNFKNMPELEVPWGYYAVWALTVVGFGVALWMLWLRRWMTDGRRALRRQRLGTFVPTAVDPVRLTTLAGRTMARNLRRRIR